MELIGNDFRIIRAGEKYLKRIEEFLRVHFHPYEPITNAPGMISGHRCSDQIVPYLAEGRSLLAVAPEEEAKIVGVCLVKINTSSEQPTENPNHCANCVKVGKLIGRLHAAADIWRSTGCDRAVNMDKIAVSSAMRRRGVAQALIEHGTKMAVAEGFPLLRMTCSSSYSQALALKAGMECVAQIRYDEYVDERGEQLIRPSAPHEAVMTFVKVL